MAVSIDPDSKILGVLDFIKEAGSGVHQNPWDNIRDKVGGLLYDTLVEPQEYGELITQQTGQTPRIASDLERLMPDQGSKQSIILPFGYNADGDIRPAVPRLARGVADVGLGLLGETDKAIHGVEGDIEINTETGEVSPYTTDEAGGVFNALIEMMGLGLAVPKKGVSNAVGMFGGKLAKTADLAALDKAKKMASDGANKNDIWKETGWFTGADGQWRFEIDDSKSDIHRLIKSGDITDWRMGSLGIDLKETLPHDKLYAAYPDVGKVPTQGNLSGGIDDLIDLLKGKPARQQGGSYSPKGISVSGDTATARSTLLHEGQHGIQDIEGFARGGSPDNVDVVDMDALRAIRAKKKALNIDPYAIQNRIQSNFNVPDEDLAKLNEWEILKSKEDDILAAQVDPYDAYKRLAGEVEARNVQTRMDMTPEQRRAKSPWETQDVPDDEQIVKFRGGGKSLSALDDVDNIITGAERDANFKNWGNNRVTKDTQYHGTFTDNIEEFELQNNDLGFHFGTVEQANERLKLKGKNKFGGNIIPVDLNLKNPVRMDDVGAWNDPFEVVQSLGAENVGGKQQLWDDITDEMEDIVNSFEDRQAWMDSPEATELRDEIVDLLKRDGYDGVVYKNEVENLYGSKTGLNRAAVDRQKPIQKEMTEINNAIGKRQMKMPPIDASEEDVAKWLAHKPKATPEEAERLAELRRQLDAIGHDNKNYNSPDSYIAFDAPQIKSIHNRGTYDPKDANILKGIAPIAGAGLLGAGMMRQEEQQPQQGLLN